MNSWFNIFEKKGPQNSARWFLVDRKKVMPEPTKNGSLKVYISQYDVPDAFRAYVKPDNPEADYYTAVIEFRYIDLGEKKEIRKIDSKHDVEIGVHTKRAYKVFIRFPKTEAEHQVAFELVPDDITRVIDSIDSDDSNDNMQYSAAKNAVLAYKENLAQLLFPA